jgi:formylglycine-generating enzyme required for sulfatase activity
LCRFVRCGKLRIGKLCAVWVVTTVRLKRIFLAHASEDKKRVRKLYQDLKSQGFEPWLDEEDLLPGQTWEAEISRAIRAAGVFVACLSKHSITKQGFVQTELRLALKAYGDRPPGSIYLIPAKLEECEVPDLQIPSQGSSLRDLHWGELWHPGGLERLIRAIRTALDIPQAAPAPVPEAAASAEFVVHAFHEPGVKAAVSPLVKPENDERARTPRVLIGNPGPDPAPGTIFKDIDAPWCPEMVVIPSGSFLMGSPDRGHLHSRPQHQVTIARAFALGRFPLTFEEYDHFCSETGREKPDDEAWGRGRRPAINVTFDDARDYSEWLAEVTEQLYRLPSEAEWEYACRAGTTTPFWTGVTISTDQANYDGRQTYGRGVKGPFRGLPMPVNTFPPNPWDLHDMHGNVWEWCEDRWTIDYRGAPTDGSARVHPTDYRRVYRGGSWHDFPWVLVSANRVGGRTDARLITVGFRVARTLISP